MTDHDPQVAGAELQFEQVVTPFASAASSNTLAVTCAACRTQIGTEYYDVNGNHFCGQCRTAAELIAETPRGMKPLLTATLFGLAAGILGAIAYYAVIAIAHLEIGIVAILIGYMVGYAIRKGTRGRGGRRFQVVAVALTYFSIALAYTPIAIQQALASRTAAQKSSATAPPGNVNEPAVSAARRPPAAPRPGGLLIAFAMLLALVVALPVFVVVGSFPSGLISAFIMFLGMRQAWRMTGAPSVQVLGPYRVGAVQASPTV